MSVIMCSLQTSQKNFSLSSAAFLTQTVCLDDTTVKFEIWDTAGQERYHSLAPMYYRGAQAAIVVYDITNTVSYEHHGRTSAKIFTSLISLVLLTLISQPVLMITSFSRQAQTFVLFTLTF